MTPSEDRTVRQIAAELVREWAASRLRSDNKTALIPSGGIDVFNLTKSERDLFERCADDIERGRR